MNRYVRIIKLLDAIKADFPRRKKQFERAMKRYGLSEPITLAIEEPEKLRTLPTFAKSHRCNLTPMLKARFEYAGTWDYAGEHWLGISAMEKWLRKRDVRSYHRALRQHYENSAPMLFEDHQLGLFSVTPGVVDTMAYFVWPYEDDEPEIWCYEGYEFDKFENLEEHLEWRLKRK